MAKKPETNFRNNIVTPFLKTLGNTCVLPIQQRSIHGDPDFILCSLGLFVALELKSELGQMSALQEYKKRRIEKSGGVWITASPKNWVHVMNRLKIIDQGE